MNRKSLFYTITISALLFSVVTGSVRAYSLIERKDLSLDEALYVKEQEVYAFPEKILITKIAGAPEYLENDPELWYKMLYYYYVTRLEMADLPYNYIVNRDGQVYQGRSGWPGVIPELDSPEGVVLIGYMSNGSDLTTPAREALQELIEDLSYRYGIVENGVLPVDLDIVSKESGTLSKLNYSSSTGVFSDEVKQLLPQLRYTNEDHYEISAFIGQVDYQKEIGLGEDFEVTVNVKNSGENPWFTFNDFVYVVTADGTDSEFSVNQEWDSFDAPTHIEEVTLFPDENYEVKFNMKAPLVPGDYKQDFALRRLGKPNLSGSSFTVSFSVTPGDVQLVKILETPTGNLNVRSLPSTGGQVLGQVDEGKLFVLVEENGQWFKIKWNGEEEGWVFGQYVQKL
ncbi:SH3 domain-containing protein [Candidatus Nomurabacteria bacterium]|uniref:SH3 domain-containing protein n=1 Tax=Candidatus Dojkabacteria bacterium TaxID=2099670 RepID=A0A955I9D3_9BACT|nr:SH3 domain-containing protein [Candidatus Dojkabacteria bacterium]MCB9789428.1 SH3 domain-containing protein [Candidatus Nomurabacteria bacterium]MCB9803750.1 SH3 domain-containing protein [Candidatus Nomurabacteria bacterium]